MSSDNILSRMTAIILAGGKGTRLAALHPDIPKPMIAVNGKPFLHWLTLWLVEQGIGDFVFSTGYCGDQIETWLSQTPILRDAKQRALREPDPLGTGGAVRACLALCKRNIMVVNGDSLILTNLAPVANHMESSDIDGVVIGKHVGDTGRYGSLTLGEGNFLQNLNEKQSGSGLINAGLYCFRKTILERFPLHKNLSMEYDIIPTLIENRARLYVHTVTAATPFLDIGTPETITLAGDFVARHLENRQDIKHQIFK